MNNTTQPLTVDDILMELEVRKNILSDPETLIQNKQHKDFIDGKLSEINSLIHWIGIRKQIGL